MHASAASGKPFSLRLELSGPWPQHASSSEQLPTVYAGAGLPQQQGPNCLLVQDCSDDKAVAKWLVHRHGVSVIPGSGCGKTLCATFAFLSCPSISLPLSLPLSYVIPLCFLWVVTFALHATGQHCITSQHSREGLAAAFALKSLSSHRLESFTLHVHVCVGQDNTASKHVWWRFCRCSARARL